MRESGSHAGSPRTAVRGVGVLLAALPRRPSGAVLRGYRLACDLHSRGVDTYLVVKEHDEERENEAYETTGTFPADHIVEVSRPVNRFDAKRLGGPLWPLLSLAGRVFEIFRIVKATALDRRFTIVHIFVVKGRYRFVPIVASKLCGKRVVVEITLLGSDDPRTVLDRSGPLRRVLLRLAYSMVDVFVSRGDEITDSIRSGLGAKAGIHITANPVDMSRFRPLDGPRGPLRGRLGLPAQAPLVLWAGVLSSRKRVHLIAEAMQHVRRDHGGAVLVLVGGTKGRPENEAYRDELEQGIDGLGLRGHVVFTGPVANIEEFMRAADVFVFASVREGLPNVVAEAMACGLPVVTTPFRGVNGTGIVDGVSGMIAGEDSAAGLAAGIGKVLGDARLRETISARAREEAVNRFAADTVFDGYAALYGELGRERNSR